MTYSDSDHECPAVTVILPLYNKQGTIVRALESVFAQRMKRIEVIVVDDGSTDDSLKAAKSVSDSRLQIIQQENQGPGAARNRGASLARAPLLAFLDSDDAWKEDFLEAAVAALDSSADCVAYACGYDSGAFRRECPNVVAELVDAPGPRLLDADGTARQIKRWVDGLHSSSVVVRKEIFDRFGGFFDRDHCLYGEDSFLWLQVLFAGPIFWDPAERIYFHVEDSALGFAVKERRIARPISLYPHLLEQNCAPEKRDQLRRAVRAYVEMDLNFLSWSRSFAAAYRLRRLHGLPAMRELVADVGRRVRNRLTG